MFGVAWERVSKRFRNLDFIRKIKLGGELLGSILAAAWKLAGLSKSYWKRVGEFIFYRKNKIGDLAQKYQTGSFDQLLPSLLLEACWPFFLENKLNSKFLEGALGSEKMEAVGSWQAAGKRF